MCPSSRLAIAMRALGIAAIVFSGMVAATDGEGAPRGRLFGPSRGESDDNEPKQTYYQPRELQAARSPQAALPVPDLTVAESQHTDEKPTASPADAGKKPSAAVEVGDPLAASKLALLLGDISQNLSWRQLDAPFSRWRSYMAGRGDASMAKNTASELDGNCRLKWYAQMMRDPMAAPDRAECFTRELHQAVLRGPEGIGTVLQAARRKLDLSDRPLPKLTRPKSPAAALELLEKVLAVVRADYQAAIAPLSDSETAELAGRSYSVFVGGNVAGHTLDDRTSGRRLYDLIQKMDRGALQSAAEDLLPLLSNEFLAQLDAIPDKGEVQVPGVSGRVLRQIPTEAGTIIVGGRGKNVYRLDDMPEVAAVIDLGGDDEYIDGVVSRQRPVLVLIDRKGNDRYRSTRPATQGAAILGVSLLLDCEGDDLYDARDVAQASAIAGVGILMDLAGNDVYNAHRRAQGHALGGIGLLVDRSGDDRYRCAMWGQGFGGPLGFGLLDDVRGDDHYFLGGVYPDSYKETPGLEGWGQGVGAGIRQVANGGIGVLLDGSGDDVYEFDYLAHGGGYWCGLGFLRDFAGNDRHLGSTEQSYSGGPRTQPQYQRFGTGWGCHFAMGFVFDDAGDDVYRGWIMGMGFGWDCSFGLLADLGGSDRYEGYGSSLQGNGAQGSMGVLFDYGGSDAYTGQSQGYAVGSTSYHPLPACGGNFSFLVDYGGSDQYGCGAGNDVILQRGWAGGFLIDRSQAGEVAKDADAAPPEPASGAKTAAMP